MSRDCTSRLMNELLAHAVALTVIKNEPLALTEALKGGDSMAQPKLTGYGWLVRLPDGRLIEVATEAEAIELLEQSDS